MTETHVYHTEINEIHMGGGHYALCREEYCEAGFPVRRWVSRTYSMDGGQAWEVWPKTARELEQREVAK